MLSEGVSANAGGELSLSESTGDNELNSALLAAMRLWEVETQEEREAEEERASRLRQLMNKLFDFAQAKQKPALRSGSVLACGLISCKPHRQTQVVQLSLGKLFPSLRAKAKLARPKSFMPVIKIRLNVASVNSLLLQIAIIAHFMPHHMCCHWQ